MERSGKTTRFGAFFGFLDQKRCTPPFYLAQKCRPVQSQNQRLPKPSHFSVFVTPSPIPQQAFTPRIIRHFPNLILPHILPPHTFFYNFTSTSSLPSRQSGGRGAGTTLELDTAIGSVNGPSLGPATCRSNSEKSKIFES